MEKEVIIEIPLNIQTEKSTYEFLANFAQQLKSTTCDTLIIDMSKVQFVASNQFAVLGCLLDDFVRKNEKTTIRLKGLNNIIIDMIRKNGFYVHCGLEPLPDLHNTVVPYKIFDVQDIKKYESYLTLKIFSREDLPPMSLQYKHMIQDYLLEAFKNVNDHTTSTFVYTCGQFFPKSGLLYFTIVDSGETIPYNVTRYLQKHGSCLSCSSLQWALQEGTSTLDDAGPRGVGLYLIKDFINSNQGRITIISGTECYEFSNSKERYLTFEHSFPGTIVTLAFNLNDKTYYGFDNIEIEF